MRRNAGGEVIVLTSSNPGNPKRKRSTKKRARRSASASAAPKRRSGRRRPRRNPALSLPRVNVAGFDVMKIGLGVVGGLGTVIGVNAVSRFMPPAMQTGVGRLFTKAGVILAGAMVLPSIVGREATRDLVVGAGTVVAFDAAREFLAPHVPGLSGLMESPYMLSSEISGYVRGGDSLAALSPVNPPAWARVA